jgi:two-component system, LytTR family, response regulator
MRDLRVVVVEDEPLARERVVSLVRATAGFELVGEAGNGLVALDLVAREEPDILFIDVEMPELNGFGVVAALELERAPAVVFITAFDRYALQAFDVGAVDYIQKPVTRERFAAAALRVKERVTRSTSIDLQRLVADATLAARGNGYRTRYVVRRGNAHHFVPVEEIEWIDVADNYLCLHTSNRAHLCRGTMKQAEDELDPERFVRVHRSAMVAVDRITSIRTHDAGGYVLTMKGGATLRSSRQYAERIRALLR